MSETLQSQPPRSSVAVVISTWHGSPPSYLPTLRNSMRRKPSGTPYELYLVMNGPGEVSQASAAGFRCIFRRENTGYNIGAWDHAWRQLPDHEFFLFIQDDCRILKRNWLARFRERFQQVPSCGLVGESVGWDKAWTQLTEGVDTCQISEDDLRTEDVPNRARFYKSVLADWSVPPGETARHVSTIVQFTSRNVLTAVDGYNHPETYQQAIAAEIGFSRKVVAAGYTLAQVGKYRFSVIGHRQWYSDSPVGRLKEKLFRDGPDRLKRMRSARNRSSDRKMR